MKAMMSLIKRYTFTNKSSWRATCQSRRKPRIKATLTLPFEKQGPCVKILDTQKKREFNKNLIIMSELINRDEIFLNLGYVEKMG
jgi:hypothetical protein